jgi:hypothetical protein
MRSLILALGIAVLLSGHSSALAEPYAQDTLIRMFRIEFQAAPTIKAKMVDGYVYNRDLRATGRIVLRIDQVDASGRSAGTTTTWVLGVVASGNRAYFVARVPDASSYRVQVESFEWIRCGD